MLVIKKFIFNPFSENTYLIWDEETYDAIVIDPGCIDPFEENLFSDYIRDTELDIKFMINTHCHIDHIMGTKFIKEKYNPVYLVPEEDLPLLQNAAKQGAAFGIEVNNPPHPDKFINEDLKLKLGNSEFQFLFTPGHSPGEYCIYFKEEKFCLTGDVLFQAGVGRTDLWGADYETLMKSITNKLLTLDDEVVIYPGHGEKSSIGVEKKENPFILEYERKRE